MATSTESRAPTERQGEILRFIAERVTDGGIPPTFRELARRFSIRSTNAVADHVHALARKGLLQQNMCKARGLTVTDSGWDWLRMPRPRALKIDDGPKNMRDMAERYRRAAVELERAADLLEAR